MIWQFFVETLFEMNDKQRFNLKIQFNIVECTQKYSTFLKIVIGTLLQPKKLCFSTHKNLINQIKMLIYI